MRSLQIAFKDLKVVGRDLKALAIIIAMPLVLVMILGAALGPMFGHTDRIASFKVAVVDQDWGQLARRFLDVLLSDQLRSLIIPQDAGSEDDARVLIAEKKVACAVVIPGGVSEAPTQSTRTFKVLGDPETAVKSEVMKAIVDSFVEQYSVVAAGTTAVVESLMKAIGPPSSTMAAIYPGGVDSLVASIIDSVADETTKAAGFFAESRQDRGWITSVQYYAAAMTVMFVMFGACLGAKSILEEKSGGTMSRLFATGASRMDLMAGKTLATFLISYIQLLVLVFFTRYVYNIKWGPSMLNVALVSAVIALAATGFAMLIAAVARTEKRADAFEQIGVQVMAFLGGCQFPIYGFPKAIQPVSKLTLTRWGLDAYLTLMDGQGLAGVAIPSLVLLAMGLFFLAFGISRLELD